MGRSRKTDYQRSLRFPANLKTEIDRYAGRNELTFAEAVRRLCEIALTNSSDEVYAPRLEKLLEKSEDSVVARIETAVSHAIDEVVAEIRLSEVRKAVMFDDDEPDEGGYNPNVFIPERRPGEKEIIWPR